jgi:hypothetical protein
MLQVVQPEGKPRAAATDFRQRLLNRRIQLIRCSFSAQVNYQLPGTHFF